MNCTSERRRQPRMPRLSPTLLAALDELAAVEDIDLNLLVTLLINSGLDHRRGRTC